MNRRNFVRTASGIVALTTLGVGTTTAHGPAGAPSNDAAETHHACTQMPEETAERVCAGTGDRPPENMPNED